MRVEKVVEEGGRVLQRIGDVQRRSRLVRGFERLGVRGDLAQRRREARRVACEERTRGVGEELALARDRKLNERGDDRGEQREGDRDHGDDRVAATVALAAPAARPEERPPHPVGEERDRAYEDRYAEQPADVE